MLDGTGDTSESEGGECGDGGRNRDDNVFTPGQLLIRMKGETLQIGTYKGETSSSSQFSISR